MDYKAEIDRLVERLIEQGFNSICFWLPAYNIGGGTYSFCQLAMYLEQHTDLNVYYMDYKDGFPTQILRESNIKILDYRDEDVEFPLREKCIVVTNSTRVIQLKRMNPESKILFWHYETAPTAWHIVFLFHEHLNFFQLCKDNNAMIFHDWSSRNIFKQQYGFIFENKSYLHMWLPPKKPLSMPGAFIKEGEMHLTWLGRVSGEKVNSIYYIIDNYAKYTTNKKKVFHIVGDGLMMDALKKYVQMYKHKIQFDLVGSVPTDQLNDYLVRHTDILFAMGLSAIEGAALKIPTAVVLLDHRAIKGDLFFWLHNTREYCVGVTPKQVKDFHIEYSHFADMLDDVFEDKKKGVVARKCYLYYQKNVSSNDELMRDFLTYLNSSTLTMKKLQECIRYIPYNNIKLKRRKLLGKVISEKIVNEKEFV